MKKTLLDFQNSNLSLVVLSVGQQQVVKGGAADFVVIDEIDGL